MGLGVEMPLGILHRSNQTEALFHHDDDDDDDNNNSWFIDFVYATNQPCLGHLHQWLP